MQLSGKTILVTGGTSGIGRELVRSLSLDNEVLVIARPGSRLDALSQEFPGIAVFGENLSKPLEYKALVDRIIRSYSCIDVLINNAAVQYTPTYLDNDFTYESISHEINMNFTSVCALSYLLLPALLKGGKDAVIVNINSGLALAPKTHSAIYCATKAAMNTFSQSLSYQLEDTNIQVMQAFLPLVDTPMTEGRGKGKLTAHKVAECIVDGIEKDIAVNNVGKVKLLRFLLALVPGAAYKIMKGS